MVFQSTLPARGATNLKLGYGGIQKISIHAPRTGSNRTSSSIFPGRPHFNPRSPHGERRKVLANWDNDLIISIHAPRTGSDNTKKHFEEDNTIFQSTLPARGATIHLIVPHTIDENFNPRSPHGERRGGGDGVIDLQRFQSTLPARGATRKIRQKGMTQ